GGGAAGAGVGPGGGDAGPGSGAGAAAAGVAAVSVVSAARDRRRLRLAVPAVISPVSSPAGAAWSRSAGSLTAPVGSLSSMQSPVPASPGAEAGPRRTSAQARQLAAARGRLGCFRCRAHRGERDRSPYRAGVNPSRLSRSSPLAPRHDPPPTDPGSRPARSAFPVPAGLPAMAPAAAGPPQRGGP